MSVLIYGSGDTAVRMQVQKTSHLGFGPTQTADGVDYLKTEIDFGVYAVVNTLALATVGPTVVAGSGGLFFDDAPAGGAAPGVAGDPLGLSLRNLRAMLMAPRQALLFTIGPDAVINIPAGGDAGNGPIPQRDTRVVWIAGTATAYIYFHVRCWIVEWVPLRELVGGGAVGPPLPHVVLANRYRVTSTTDDDFYARRHIAGQMIVDPSQLALLSQNGVLTPDNFRQACFLQIPLGFKRWG
jgi:hypothetical protein